VQSQRTDAARMDSLRLTDLTFPAVLNALDTEVIHLLKSEDLQIYAAEILAVDLNSLQCIGVQ